MTNAVHALCFIYFRTQGARRSTGDQDEYLTKHLIADVRIRALSRGRNRGTQLAEPLFQRPFRSTFARTRKGA